MINLPNFLSPLARVSNRIPKSKIFVTITDEFGVRSALEKSFNFFEIPLDKLETVAVKLNLCNFKLRETGATSDPIVVEQLVRFLNDSGVQVRLVESDSASKDADLVFHYLGFKDLEKKLDVKCINLSRDDFSTRKIDGYRLKSVKVPKSIETADFFISHPKLKTHTNVYLSGALKNQFGCLVEKRKFVYHPWIDEVIADVNLAFKPDLVIMDAITAMAGYGPINGIPQRLNMLITSEDPVAVDCFGSKIFGFSTFLIKHIQKAAKKGLGNKSYLLYGDDIKNVKMRRYLSKNLITIVNILSHIRSFPEPSA